jgi:tripartite ATP-independent transporter DctP family solute receptor
MTKFAIGKTAKSLFLSAAILFTAAAVCAKPITLKFGHCSSAGETDPYQLTAVLFQKALEEVAPGEFEVQIFPNRQLGDEKEMLEGLSFGTLDMAAITNSPISRISLPFQINDMPFIYENEAHAYKVLDGPVGEKLLQTLAAKNILGLGFAEGGFRHMINNVRPIGMPDDAAGIKWRVMPNPVYIEMFRSLGGNAVPMPWGECFTALQQGAIDGLEIPVAVIFNNGYYEVAKYCSLTNHTYSALGVMISKRKFDKLTPQQQEAIRKASRKAIDAERLQNVKNVEVSVGKLKEKGMAVNPVKDFKAFQKKVTKVYDEFRPNIGDEIFNQVIKP